MNDIPDLPLFERIPLGGSTLPPLPRSVNPPTLPKPTVEVEGPKIEAEKTEPTAPTNPPEPRWVAEAIRDLFTPTRGKAWAVAAAGGLIAGAIGLNAYIGGANRTQSTSVTSGKELAANKVVAKAEGESTAFPPKRVETEPGPDRPLSVPPVKSTYEGPARLPMLPDLPPPPSTPVLPATASGIPAIPTVPEIPATPVLPSPGIPVISSPVIPVSGTADPVPTPTPPAIPALPGEKPVVPALPAETPTPKVETPVLPKVEMPVLPKTESPVLPKVEMPVLPKTESPVLPKVESPVVPKTEIPTTPKSEFPAVLPAETPSLPKKETPVIPAPIAVTPEVKPSTPEVSPKLEPPATPLTFPKTVTTGDLKPVASTEPPRTDFDVDLHEPKAGESYDSISKQYYGDARYGPSLRQFNRGQDFGRGGSVSIPPLYVLRQRFGTPPASAIRTTSGERERTTTDRGTDWTPSGGQSYTVPKSGMTMSDVAEEVLGDRRQWRRIFDNNTRYNPDLPLPEGAKLQLPSDAKVK